MIIVLTNPWHLQRKEYFPYSIYYALHQIIATENTYTTTESKNLVNIQQTIDKEIETDPKNILIEVFKSNRSEIQQNEKETIEKRLL